MPLWHSGWTKGAVIYLFLVVMIPNCDRNPKVVNYEANLSTRERLRYSQSCEFELSNECR